MIYQVHIVPLDDLEFTDWDDAFVPSSTRVGYVAAETYEAAVSTCKIAIRSGTLPPDAFVVDALNVEDTEDEALDIPIVSTYTETIGEVG